MLGHVSRARRGVRQHDGSSGRSEAAICQKVELELLAPVASDLLRRTSPCQVNESWDVSAQHVLLLRAAYKFVLSPQACSLFQATRNSRLCTHGMSGVRVDSFSGWVFQVMETSSRCEINLVMSLSIQWKIELVQFSMR